MRQRERKGPWLILLKVLKPVHVDCTSLSEAGYSGLKGLIYSSIEGQCLNNDDGVIVSLLMLV